MKFFKKNTLRHRSTSALSITKSINWKLYFIADFESAGGKDLVWVVKEAVKGGVGIVQLRVKTLSTHEFLNLGKEIHNFLKKKGIPFIVNDRIDIALALNADGVHLGQQDMPLSIARKLIGKSKLIGISVNNLKEALEAERGGGNYIGVGPVFPTSTKPDIRTPIGIEGLRKIRERVKIPVIAIGGINKSNAKIVYSAGINGVAVVSAILSSSNPMKSTQEILKELNRDKRT